MIDAEKFLMNKLEHLTKEIDNFDMSTFDYAGFDRYADLLADRTHIRELLNELKNVPNTSV